MKILSTLLFITLFFVGCSNVNFENRNVEAKDKLIQKANNANLDAMLDLAKYYKFPQTKEGLYYFNKWYPLVEKSKNIEKQTSIAKIYYKYNDMFINGEKRATKLLEKSSDAGDIEASIFLLKKYVLDYKGKKANDLFDKISGKLTEEQLTDLYNTFAKKHRETFAREVLAIIKKKGYEEPFLAKLNDIESLLYLRKKNDKEINDFVNYVINSKDLEKILETEKLFKRKYGYRDYVIKLKEESLKYDKSNSKIYLELAKMYAYPNRSSNKEKAFGYLEKASELSNKKASTQLLNIYSNSKDYINKFNELKQRLLQNNEGKLILAKYYFTHKKESMANKLYEEVANDGNNEAIAQIVTRRQSSYSFDPEEYELTNKWQENVLKSNDQELKEKILEKINSLYSKRYIKDFSKKLEQQIVVKKEDTKNSDKNILNLRKLAETKLRKRNYEEGIKYYALASSYGDVYSKRMLAKVYLRRSVKQYDKALKLLKELTEKGDRKAKYELISLYSNPPYGYEKKPLKAMELYKKDAEKGDIYAIEKLTRFYICESCYGDKYIDYKKGLFYVNKLIELRGNGVDYTTLGWLYNYGKGVDVDLEKAKNYYLIATGKRYAAAYNRLANLYYQEDKSLPIIRLDYKEARKYLDLAYKNGYRDSAYLLGKFYEKGYGVKKDIDKAIKYYKNVARSNNSVANYVGEYYKKKKDYIKAIKYFKYASYDNYSDALINLGILSEKGLGTKKSAKYALRYYGKAYKYSKSQSGKDVAAYNIGLVYELGKGKIKKDIKEAKKWYKKSNLKKAKNRLKKLK